MTKVHNSQLTAGFIADQTWPREVQISPDGKQVAYVMAPFSKMGEHFSAAIWLSRGVEDDTSMQLTDATHNNRLPQWSPDGARIAFLSDRAKRGVAQLHVIPLAGGEAQPLQKNEAGKPNERSVQAFAWSPDGARIAYACADEPDAEDARRKTEKDDANVWGERLAHSRLRVVDVKTGEVKTLFATNVHVAEFAWSNSGREIALLTWTTPLTEGRERGVRLQCVDADTGAIRHVYDFPGGASNLCWSPNDRALLWLATVDGKPQNSMAVWRIPAAGGQPERIALGEASCAQELLPAGARLAVAEAAGLETRLHWLDATAGSLAQFHPGPADEPLFEVLNWHARCTEDGDAHLALSTCTAAAFPELRTAHWAATLQPRRSLRPTPVMKADMAFAPQEPFHWHAPDGLALDGLLIRPLIGTAPWPTFVLVHGGPYARSVPGLNLNWARWGQWLAETGIAVLLPNYRGGMGHGATFARWARGGVGIHDFQDITSMVDGAIARGITQPDRVGIGGWSQGGFLTAWAVTQTQRFCCGIMGAGVSDWGMLLTNDLPVFEQALGGDAPRDGLEAQQHRRTSPITHARNAKTPLLILHGENDERVPLNQAVAFHRAMRDNGTPVEFVSYPREPHAIQERAHQIDLLTRVRAWCEKHLLSSQ